MPVCVGDVIGGRYRLIEQIAKGGQAEVWEARQAPFEQRVALKILIPRCGELGIERLYREAQVLAGLNHPNIVRLIDCGELPGGSCYLAMEFIEGRRMKAVLRERKHTPAALLRLCDQVCAGLEAAHQLGVIHRDIKLSNILIHRPSGVSEQARVVDFGIARLMEGDPGLTSEGVVLGSPRFMAPELIRGEPLDARVDIYAVGVILYCCLAGRYPYNGRTAHEIMNGHLKKPLPPFRVSETLPDPEGLIALVERALARNRDERFGSMSELREALQPFISEPSADGSDKDGDRHAARG
ncbi:MAG: serine/threonine protein kinase [Myxococcota bacterium]|jgi:serine/threonine protein kinase